MNTQILRGTLVADPQFFLSRGGDPRLIFRVAVPRLKNRPPKKPRNLDFLTVVALGDRFADLKDVLHRGTEVVVMGFAQSRDLNDGRVVVETVAEYIDIVVPEARRGAAHGPVSD